MNEIGFNLAEEDLDLFVASLALGILEGIKAKVLLHEIGTWSLSRPKFLKKVSKKLNPRIIKVIEQFDELNLLNELDSKNCDSTIQNMISELKDVMLNINEDACRISWRS